MASSILSNPFLTNSTYWWMNAGLPFVLPTIGSNGSWDGSKWVQDTNTSTTTGVTDSSTIYPGYSSGNSSMSSPGISSSTIGNSGAYSGAVNGFGLSTPGFAGSFNDSAVASMGQQGALSGMANSAMASVGNAALTGSIAGGITGSLSNGISTAVAGLANPGSIAGVIGGALNGALGFNTSPAIGALAGLASLASPALGLAVGVFGPAVADLAMDAFDARDMEHSRDLAESLSNSYVGGRIAGAHISNALEQDLGLPSASKMGTVTQAYGQLGIDNRGLTQEALAAAYQDLGFAPEVAAVSALSDVVNADISDITNDFGVGFSNTQSPASSFGNPLGGFSMNGYMDQALSDVYGALSMGPIASTFGQEVGGLPSGLGLNSGITGTPGEVVNGVEIGNLGTPVGTPNAGFNASMDPHGLNTPVSEPVSNVGTPNTQGPPSTAPSVGKGVDAQADVAGKSGAPAGAPSDTDTGKDSGKGDPSGDKGDDSGDPEGGDTDGGGDGGNGGDPGSGQGGTGGTSGNGNGGQGGSDSNGGNGSGDSSGKDD